MTRGTEQLLQECLLALDQGLTPEECLSAWPERRGELEPLLRQAMLLRVAYAARPAPEFRFRARESLMFMAGREARQALAAQPNEAFLRRTRQRVLSAAGAAAQESLRAVPPPRLPFWSNARRRLLEAAAAPRPAPRPAYGGVLAFRGALSAAVLVLAVAVAGLAYFTVQRPEPSIGAQLASIDQQLREVEEQASAGQPVAPEQIAAVTSKLVSVADKVSANPVQAPAAKELIDRTQVLAQQVGDTQSAAKLNDAEVKISAAGIASPITPVVQVQPTVATNLAPAGSTPSAPAAASPTAAAPAPTGTAAAVVALPPLGPGDIRLRPAVGDVTAGLNWALLETSTYRVLVPTSWSVNGVQFDANGVGKLDIQRITIIAPEGLFLNINLNSGEINGLTSDGTQLALREETSQGGERMSVVELVGRVPALAIPLDHLLSSVVHSLPTPVPTATSTATQTSTPPPAPTGTPTP
jgi:hypothetical protein